MLTVVHVIGSKNNSRAGTKWQAAVFEICEGRPRGAISPCALERHVLYLATSAAVHGGRCGADGEAAFNGPPQSLADRSACLSRRRGACMHGAMACLGADPIKFSLDGRLEGLAATFFLPQDRGYFRAQVLQVT